MKAPDAASETPSTALSPARPAPKGRRTWLWGAAIAGVLAVELFVYGYRGHVTTCVGKAPETDFTLVGEARTDENRWKFPRCEQRLNLGLRGGFEARRDDAAASACRGATLLRYKGEKEMCMRQEGEWSHRVTAEQCWPWHRHFVSHLFWFLHD